MQQGPQLGTLAPESLSSTLQPGPPLKETRLITSSINHDTARGSTDDEDTPDPTVICVLNRPVFTTARQDIINTKGHMVIDIAADLEVGQGVRKDIARLHGGLDQHFSVTKTTRRLHYDTILPDHRRKLHLLRYLALSQLRPIQSDILSGRTSESARYSEGMWLLSDTYHQSTLQQRHCTGMDIRNALQRTFGNAGIHVRLCLDPFGC